MVVFPLVPVTATMGILDTDPGGNSHCTKSTRRRFQQRRIRRQEGIESRRHVEVDDCRPRRTRRQGDIRAHEREHQQAGVHRGAAASALATIEGCASAGRVERRRAFAGQADDAHRFAVGQDQLVRRSGDEALHDDVSAVLARHPEGPFEVARTPDVRVTPCDAP